MNAILEAFARQWLKDSIAACSPKEQQVFLMMYSHLDREAPIGRAVDAMPVEKLDWAMIQVKRTLDRQRRAA